MSGPVLANEFASGGSALAFRRADAGAAFGDHQERKDRCHYGQAAPYQRCAEGTEDRTNDEMVHDEVK